MGSAARDVPPLVLVVDDYDDVREMYSEYLEHVGFDATGAKDGQEAIDLAISLRPQAIVMDLAMPFLDGWQATKMLKADDRTAHVPIVVVTGNALPEQMFLARAAGADVVLTKPCHPRTLADAVVGVLGYAPA